MIITLQIKTLEFYFAKMDLTTLGYSPKSFK